MSAASSTLRPPPPGDRWMTAHEVSNGFAPTLLHLHLEDLRSLAFGPDGGLQCKRFARRMRVRLSHQGRGRDER